MKFPVDKKTVSILAMMCILLVAGAPAAFAADAPTTNGLNNSAAIMMITIAVALLLAIGMLAYVLIGAAGYHVEQLKKNAQTAAKPLVIVALCMFTSTAFAQPGETAATAEVTSTTIAGLSKSSFYLLTGLIGLEVIIVLAMLIFLRQLLAKEKPQIVVEFAEARIPFYITWWNKLNAIRPVHEEATITLEHEYDGIRELDNKLPPWWVYGFYLCIIFSVVYLYRFHVSHSAPSTIQEYEIAMVQAEQEKQEYLKTAANNVDENTVELLSDASALSEGKKIFASTCAACHGSEGQGTVGPNLTDDYWLHKGGVKDIFKTIKYGVPEKGMKSWKDDFSPVQIAAIASYIKSIRGTKPSNPKEPQGDLYQEEALPAAEAATAMPEKKLAKQ
ncbi:c-type cytochrome [Segetibacter sp. 3557_3]|uniref:cbb3-type cytochrome c oxidase N-terminal domain-containing protein n=1 Tax=Segetibacter sp. 3557_3 TaxID=2547429 RepID=UPI001058770C|nr:cbb3-type cytochrome c oxidase N-terminal domain-containing protein [Segetibacter sp. 3557_3]TDH24653.1 c-type cytochrome [Segetibacter sp. 3557_3]